MANAPVFFAVLSGLVSLCGSSLGAQPTLRFLSIVHRHGERAPYESYPLDPYKSDSYWPDGRRELLKSGKMTMFEVGKFLRQRYDGFIPSKYKISNVLVRSTPVNRTIMSVQLLLAGLYPPVDDQIWNPHLLWQPIPAIVLDPTVDSMMCPSKPCPRFWREYENYLSSRKPWIKEYSDLYSYLRNHSGFDFTGEYDLANLQDNLLIEEEQGLKLPEWTKSVYPDKITPMFREEIIAFRQNPTLVKFVSGVLINDILSDMQRKRKEKDAFERRLNLYSGHDTTIQNLWAGMGITKEMPLPNYGAMFIVELHEIKDEYRVKVLYKHGAKENLTVLSVKGCEVDQELFHDGLCNLDVLDHALESIKITDFDQECSSPLGLGKVQPPTQC